ncbi:restriction endonuclease subunit S [Arcobacter sp. s6]|uniref:restriction endonuclease subunit S n=1 Tax=Arcobacter sp. s6 TaxID=3230363 RepID=UPI00349FD2F6
MTTKSKVPQIRFKGFNQKWDNNKFEEITTINQGLQIAISNRFTQKIDGSYFYITNEFLKKGSNIKYFILNPPESVLCSKDDVLMTRTGNTGEVVTNIDGAFHNNFFKIKFDSKKLTKDYLVYFLKLPKTQKLILSLAGVSTIPDLNHKDFYSIRIFFSKDIKEQVKIGDYFQQLDKLIEQKEKKYQKLKQFKKAMLDKMFPKNGADTPEIRFKGFIGKWEEKEINELFIVTRGDVLAATETSSQKSEKMPYPVYSSQTKNNGLLGFYKKYLFENAITWTTDGANAGTVKYREGKFYSTNVNGVLLSNDGYANLAIAEILNNIAWKHVSYVGNPKLMNNVMSKIKIIIPNTIEEQIQISKYIKQLDKQIDLQQKELEKLKNIKKASLAKMFV